MIITVGVSEAIDLALRALINPGDEVLYHEPCYVSYSPSVVMAHGKAVAIATRAEDNFRLTAAALKEKITARSKVLMLNFPCNPTGATQTRAELEKIARLCIDHDLIVLTDEIYSELRYDNSEHVSIASLPGMRERCIFLHGFSKAFAMTGCRIGYACAPAVLTDAMMKMHQYAILCANTMAQDAAIEALEHGARGVEAMRQGIRAAAELHRPRVQRSRPALLPARGRLLHLPKYHEQRPDQPRVLLRPAGEEKSGLRARPRVRPERRRIRALLLRHEPRSDQTGDVPHRRFPRAKQRNRRPNMNSDKVTKAVLLAAGKGTRMRELTNELPKPMIPVRGKPILQHIVEGLRDAGVSRIQIIVGWRADVVRDFFGDGSKFGVAVEYITQEVQDGTGRVVELAKEFAGADPFILSYGDILVDPVNYHRLAALDGAEALISVKHNPGEIAKGGAVFVNERFEMTDLREKPQPGEPTSPWYNAGIYTFRPSIFEFTAKLEKSPRGEYELTDAIRSLAQSGKRVQVVELSGEWADVRDPEVLAQLNEG